MNLLTGSTLYLILLLASNRREFFMSHRRERVSIFLRISPEAKAWLRGLADSHETSLNSELVRIIRAQMMAAQPNSAALAHQGLSPRYKQSEKRAQRK
jgi:hypothetical protein